MKREFNCKIKRGASKNNNVTLFHRIVLLEEGLIVSAVISIGIFLLDWQEHFKLLEFTWLFIFNFVGVLIIQRINKQEPLFRELKLERFKYIGKLDELIFNFANIGLVLKYKIGRQYIFRSNYILFGGLVQIAVKDYADYCLITSTRSTMKKFNIYETLKLTRE